MDSWELQPGFLLTNQSPISQNWTDKSQKWLHEGVQFLKVVNTNPDNDLAKQLACLDAFAMLVRFLKVVPKKSQKWLKEVIGFLKVVQNKSRKWL